ncbi:hypothetical protein SLS62_010668 [Diatrype stigma]|uniref:SnoaL-like domain-containing protein n=1 Tax=Diatrype stigma TaxID=117547 RepID=A0AAN9YHZ3_9PEZI
MTSPYDIQTYLLDRANIHDTVTRMAICIDTRSTEGMVRDVYAPQVEIDYTSLLGGEPSRMTGEAWARSLEPMGEAFDSTQHVYTSFLIELPQPSSPSSPARNASARPDSCTVVAYGCAHMTRKGAEGDSMIHNGGIVYFEVTRLGELEEQGKNPWRISKQRAVKIWEEGNKELMKPLAAISAPISE